MVASEVLQILPRKFREAFDKYLQEDKLQEIRFRVGQPVELIGKERINLPMLRVEKGDIKEMLEYISNYSLYAFDEEIAQGFLTIPGGHRIGVAGQIVTEQGQVKNMRNISFVNVRISREIVGCGAKVLPYIKEENSIYSTLIISPPCCGKTTLLRDLVRLISGGITEQDGKHVVVIDERSEIAGCYRGIPQNDLGCRTDVLDACPKSLGMMMAVRSMAPEVMVVDEIGGETDIQALRYAMNSGCALLATIHGNSREELQDKPEMATMIREKCFERYIILERSVTPGVVQKVLDAKGDELYVHKGIREYSSCVRDNRIRYVSGR